MPCALNLCFNFNYDNDNILSDWFSTNLHAIRSKFNSVNDKKQVYSFCHLIRGVLIDFTLSDARHFTMSMANPLGMKELTTSFYMSCQKH